MAKAEWETLLFGGKEILVTLEEDLRDPDVQCYEWWEYFNLARIELSKPTPSEVISIADSYTDWLKCFDVVDEATSAMADAKASRTYFATILKGAIEGAAGSSSPASHSTKLVIIDPIDTPSPSKKAMLPTPSTIQSPASIWGSWAFSLLSHSPKKESTDIKEKKDSSPATQVEAVGETLADWVLEG